MMQISVESALKSPEKTVNATESSLFTLMYVNFLSLSIEEL